VHAAGDHVWLDAAAREQLEEFEDTIGAGLLGPIDVLAYEEELQPAYPSAAQLSLAAAAPWKEIMVPPRRAVNRRGPRPRDRPRGARATAPAPAGEGLR
jgi:hypothetical protein